jgi:hypothetical protein
VGRPPPIYAATNERTSLTDVPKTYVFQDRHPLGARKNAALGRWKNAQRVPTYRVNQLRRNPMAFHLDRSPNTAGELNTAFNVLMIVALLGFAIASTYFYG